MEKEHKRKHPEFSEIEKIMKKKHKHKHKHKHPEFSEMETLKIMKTEHKHQHPLLVQQSNQILPLPKSLQK